MPVSYPRLCGSIAGSIGGTRVLMHNEKLIKSALSTADFIITGAGSGLSKTCFVGETSGLLYDNTGTFNG